MAYIVNFSRPRQCETLRDGLQGHGIDQKLVRIAGEEPKSEGIALRAGVVNKCRHLKVLLPFACGGRLLPGLAEWVLISGMSIFQ